MSGASSEIRIAAPRDRVWAVIADAVRYPEFVPGVRACRAVGGEGAVRRFEYEVDLGIRRVRYVLAHREEPPDRLTWSLVDGDFFSRSDGSWTLSEVAGGTLARYEVAVEVVRPPLVPRSVVDRVVGELTKVQMPRMMEAFRERAERG